MIVGAQTPSCCLAEPSQPLCTCRAGLGLLSRSSTAWQERGASRLPVPRGTPGCTWGVPTAILCQPERGAALDVLREPPWECTSLSSAGAARLCLLGASLAHTSFVLSLSCSRKPKLSKIEAMCSKSARDSVISWEGRRAGLATIPVSPKLMWMDLFSTYLFRGFLFPQWYFLNFLPYSFHYCEIWLQNQAKSQSKACFHPAISLRASPISAWGLHGERIDSEFANWQTHEKYSDLVWIPLRVFHMFKGLLSCFFSFPSVYLLLHIVKQLGNEGALLSGAALSFAFCFFLCTHSHRYSLIRAGYVGYGFSQCQNVACWPGAALQFFTFMWHYKSK